MFYEGGTTITFYLVKTQGDFPCDFSRWGNHHFLFGQNSQRDFPCELLRGTGVGYVIFVCVAFPWAWFLIVCFMVIIVFRWFSYFYSFHSCLIFFYTFHFFLWFSWFPICFLRFPLFFMCFQLFKIAFIDFLAFYGFSLFL